MKHSASHEQNLNKLLIIHQTAQAERAFRAFMDENSVDMVKKFQDLTKQLTKEDKTSVGGSENVSDNSSNISGGLSFKNLIPK